MRDEFGKPLPIEVLGRESKFAAAPELLQPGEWVCLNVDPSCSWPVRPQKAEFAGSSVWIIPLTLEEYPGVAIRCSIGIDRDDAARLLYGFLSVLSWREERGISVVHRSGGSRPHMVGLNGKHGFSVQDAFDLTEIAYPDDEEARIALALLREARSLNHYGYAFLSFWHVLELAYPVSKKRVEWMKRTLSNLTGHGIREAVESIEAQGIKDISSHLFESGRCAIAHATRKPIINPDDPRDAQRLYRELPLVREMAVRAVEERFGIVTPQTEYREHLYELRGWKAFLGNDLVLRILNGEDYKRVGKIEFPAINLELQNSSAYPSFLGMLPVDAELQDNMVCLTYRSKSELLFIKFGLDFHNERFLFSIDNGLFLNDDGSATAAEHYADCQVFIRDYLLNGKLQIRNAGNNELLTRKDAFIPVNCFIDLDACNHIIAAARAEVDRRQMMNSVKSSETGLI